MLKQKIQKFLPLSRIAQNNVVRPKCYFAPNFLGLANILNALKDVSTKGWGSKNESTDVLTGAVIIPCLLYMTRGKYFAKKAKLSRRAIFREA